MVWYWLVRIRLPWFQCCVKMKRWFFQRKCQKSCPEKFQFEMTDLNWLTMINNLWFTGKPPIDDSRAIHKVENSSSENRRQCNFQNWILLSRKKIPRFYSGWRLWTIHPKLQNLEALSNCCSFNGSIGQSNCTPQRVSQSAGGL